MKNDNYNELKELENKSRKKASNNAIILIILLVVTIIILFTFNLPGYVIPLVFIGYIVYIKIDTQKQMNSDCKNVKVLTDEIKEELVKEELSNIFNNITPEEEQITNEIEQLRIKINNTTNHSFSAKYNNIKFQYTDLTMENEEVNIYSGGVYIFDTKENWQEDIYISTKTEKNKLYFGSSLLDKFSDCEKYREIELNNKKNNIIGIIKTSGNPSIIQNTTFIEVVNKLIIEEAYTLIYKNNKLYIFINNGINLYEEKKSTFKEEKVRERIRIEIAYLKSQLDIILAYKEILNIREEQ